jgi:hypothetical protein
MNDSRTPAHGKTIGDVEMEGVEEDEVNAMVGGWGLGMLERAVRNVQMAVYVSVVSVIAP